VIGSSRREGTLGPDSGRRSAGDRPWHNLDRRAPLWLKVVSPVIGVTVLGAALFGYLLAEQPPVVWIVVAGLAIGALEVALVAALLEYGVLRRIRRVHRSVTALGRSGRRAHLSEGMEPAGRDVLFNLAREVDLKLTELEERERAGSVVTALGLLSLQGAGPSALTTRALELTVEAAGLEQCLLVDRAALGVIVISTDGVPKRSSEVELPVWMSALARSAAESRKPVLSGRLGQDSTYWDGQSDPYSAAAAFVPLAGTQVGAGVMIGLAHAGGRVTSSTVSLIESVATALTESLERREAGRARAESEEKSKTLATVTHEMRNPLNAMLGFSDLLLNDKAGPLNEKQRTYMQQVDSASRHLLSLVNDYLDLTRLVAGALPMQMEAVQIHPQVQEVFELLGPTAQAAQLTMHSSVEPGLVAQADRRRLHQVLLNLLTNAIRSTPPRGHVRVEAAGGSNGVRVSVIDTGSGIPADRQQLVFVEFADLHPGAPASNGTGLGLALSKQFVEAMGGFIRFTSSEGGGTIFDVWLRGENSPPAAADRVSVPAN